MKRITICLLLMTFLCGCREKVSHMDITGEWRLTDMALTKSVQIGDEEVDIYISFSADSTFAMWQFLGAGRYAPYAGKWSLSEDILSGTYDDGYSWGNVYKVSLEDDTLTLEATQNSSDTYVYSRTAIPDELKSQWCGYGF